MARVNLLIFLGLLCLLLAGGCIDPIDLHIQNNETRIVVEGKITDEPGPYTVRLTRPYVPIEVPAVTGARVEIYDDLGVKAELKETAPGIYKTIGGFQGKVHSTYTLFITTREGKQYRSSPEKLLPVPEINKLYYEVEQKTALDAQGREETRYFLNLFADTRDPAATKDFYFWQTNGTFRVITQPEDYFVYNLKGEKVPDPKDCCRECWVKLQHKTISVKDDRQLNGQELKRQTVIKVPITPMTLHSRIYLEVLQQSISAGAFDYWSLVKTQVNSVGNVQDPPPAFISGNVRNINDEKDVCLGYFSASAVKRKGLFVTREELGIQVDPLVYPDDCRTLDYSTTIRPDFW